MLGWYLLLGHSLLLLWIADITLGLHSISMILCEQSVNYPLVGFCGVYLLVGLVDWWDIFIGGSE